MGGGTLLGKLNDYLTRCDGILHLVGKAAGAAPTVAETHALLARYPDLAAFVSPDCDLDRLRITYTQWEAYLAIYNHVKCYVFIASGNSVREPMWTADPGDEESQRLHLERLFRLGIDRKVVPFDDAREIAIEFLSSVLDAVSVRDPEKEKDGPARRNFLPKLPIHFTKRNQYIREIVAVLKAHEERSHDVPSTRRLLITSFTGMPGVGKTCLAIAAAQELIDQYPDGCLYINLNGFSETEEPLSPELALDSLLRQSGVRQDEVPFSRAEKQNRWAEQLKNFHGIIVLDNARNVTQLEPLVPERTSALLLVTSRNQMPEMPWLCRIEVGVMEPEEAERLFQSYFRFEPETNDEAQALARCVTECGLLPLTIRIVASMWANRTRTFREIADWLTQAKKSAWVFRNSDSDAERAFNASYLLLGERTRQVFLFCGLLPGKDFSKERISAVLGSRVPPLDCLFELVDYSLLQRSEDERYSMHDLLRLFGLRRQQSLDPYEAIRVYSDSLEFFSVTFSRLAEQFENGEITKSTISGWLTRESHNIVANAELCLEHDRATVDTVALLLAPYCSRFGLNSTAYLLRVLSLKIRESDGDRQKVIMAHRFLASSLMDMGEFVEAEAHFDRALAQSEAIDRDLVSMIRMEQAFCYERLGKYEKGLHLLAAVQADLIERGRVEDLKNMYNTRGAIYWRMEEYDKALKNFFYGNDAPIGRSPSHHPVTSLNNVGFTYYKMRDFENARKFLVRSYKEERRTGNMNSMLVSLVNLGYLYACIDPTIGRRVAERAAELAANADNRFQKGRALDALGDNLLVLKQVDDAEAAWLKAKRTFDLCNAPEVLEVQKKIKGLRT